MENIGFEKLLERKTKGSLKIYLGYAAGVGKTYAMLKEGQQLKDRGYDVIVGHIELHNRPDTTNLLKGLDAVPPSYRTVGNTLVRETDIEGIIKRNPQIVLIDEMAHTNPPGAKNEKRFQDITDILDHGINVISTLNIQHLESISEKVSSTLTVPVGERVPDYVVARADQIVNVDISIEDLRQRLREGKIYGKDKAETALLHFFTHDNLALLRKLVLQEAAEDQLRKIKEDKFLPERVIQEATEAVMVAISSDATNAEALIRRGTRLASQFMARCYVVYVRRKEEAPDRIDTALQRKLLDMFRLAKLLGAEVETLEGEGVAETLVNFAQTHGVRHAVFGKPRKTPLRERLFGSVLQDFIHDSVGIEIHVAAPTLYKKEK